MAVGEYGEWLASNVSDDALKAAFRQACDITLSEDFELAHWFHIEEGSVWKMNSCMNLIGGVYGDSRRPDC
ncbi:hypothetical protein N7537_010892 [Penicillium hordei]|uniref:Uncharacterized protein n=1 Tax=Penicillium hordei TaxID=40994 RepID=A0AAD6DKQ6_9EURO|nr:uncharacterized protein N7537_010892 [Penicillium hordei]KAJ5588214.1 hypothetical protein N7537_010892 [Penicillium hordei]